MTKVNGMTELPGRFHLQAHELASFHLCSKIELEAAPVMPDWSRVTPAQHIEAGVPARDTQKGKGKGHAMQKHGLGDLGGLFYCLSPTECEFCVTCFYHRLGTTA
jgi:hypothetical protein